MKLRLIGCALAHPMPYFANFNLRLFFRLILAHLSKLSKTFARTFKGDVGGSLIIDLINDSWATVIRIIFIFLPRVCK